ncbi:hypothetical protein LA080_013102 [Diaporthe eres]|nr:hypothetical protein LA080_013102 [Diaporthe eres]
MLAAIGPFTQQSIKSYACQRQLRNISASIPAAFYVNSSFVVGHEAVGHKYSNWKMMVAALEGIVDPENNNKSVPFDCPTVDSDFPPFSSLAYCSSCTDVTAHVQQHHGPRYTFSNKTFAWNYTLPEQDCFLSLHDTNGHPRLGQTSATGSIPDHLTFCPRDQRMNRNRETGFSILSMSWVNCSLGRDDGHLDKVGCGGYPEQLSSLASTSGLVAVNCTLGLCVRDYTSRVRNGVLHETVTDSLPFRFRSHEATMFRMLKLPCIVDSNKYELSNISQIPAIPGRNFTAVSFDGQNVTVPLECVLTADEVVPWTINGFLERELLEPETACSMVSDTESFCTPWYLEPLFRGGRLTAPTISSDMNGLADRISNRIRAVGSNAYGNESGAVQGAAIQTTVCVRVDWPWLLLPATLVLLTAVLFVAVLITARYSQVTEGQPIWKSSSVVGFFHGINARSHPRDRANRDTGRRVVSTHEPESIPVSEPLLREESHEDLMNLKSMQAKAKNVVVKLETAPTGQGGFVVVKDEKDEQLVDFNKHHRQLRSSKLPRDGETLPRLQPLNNGNLHDQPSTYLHVDLGAGFNPSVRSSIDRSLRQGLEEDTE